MKNAEGWDELPEHVKTLFETTFEENPKTKLVREKIMREERNKRYATAAAIRGSLERARIEAQMTLINDQQQAVQRVSLLEMGMPHDAVEFINVRSIAMYLACDMIEFFSMDINEMLKRHDPTASFDMFDPVIKIGKEAKENLTYLWKNTRMFDTEFFNDSADDIRAMLLNKAKKVFKNYVNRTSEQSV